MAAAEPLALHFVDDGAIPNNPRLPLLIYRQAVRLGADPAAVLERLFAANGWGDAWRNGIYPYAHFHPHGHEVLGIARGQARVRFGGGVGAVIEVGAGDVAVLPAGTGHQRLSASDDLLVVGAYPPTSDAAVARGGAAAPPDVRPAIAAVPLPEQDPVFGRNGPLTTLWRPAAPG
jgi:uncharacterized protein YjlB